MTLSFSALPWSQKKGSPVLSWRWRCTCLGSFLENNGTSQRRFVPSHPEGSTSKACVALEPDIAASILPHCWFSQPPPNQVFNCASVLKVACGLSGMRSCCASALVLCSLRRLALRLPSANSWVFSHLPAPGHVPSASEVWLHPFPLPFFLLLRFRVPSLSPFLVVFET